MQSRTIPAVKTRVRRVRSLLPAVGFSLRAGLSTALALIGASRGACHMSIAALGRFFRAACRQHAMTRDRLGRIADAADAAFRSSGVHSEFTESWDSLRSLGA